MAWLKKLLESMDEEISGDALMLPGLSQFITDKP
jgi:hypothetical protein